MSHTRQNKANNPAIVPAANRKNLSTVAPAVARVSWYPERTADIDIHQVEKTMHANQPNFHVNLSVRTAASNLHVEQRDIFGLASFAVARVKHQPRFAVHTHFTPTSGRTKIRP